MLNAECVRRPPLAGGFVDVFRALRDAAAEPGPKGCPWSLPYPADYAEFFRACAGHLETVATAIGVQLEDWGVRFTSEELARELPMMEVGAGGVHCLAAAGELGVVLVCVFLAVMCHMSWCEGAPSRGVQVWAWSAGSELALLASCITCCLAQVGEGVDVRIAQSWIKDEIQEVVNWGNTFMGIIRMADQAKLPPQPAGAPGQPEAARVPVTAPSAAPCAACVKEAPSEGPAFAHCGRCGGVRYCSRACQVADWPRHKPGCKAAAPAASS
jgi:hypothetical protein